MEFSSGRFGHLLDICGLVANEGPIEEDLIRELLPLRSGIFSERLTADAIKMGASIGLFDIDSESIQLQKTFFAGALDNPHSLNFARRVLFKVVRKHYPELIALAFLEPSKVRTEVGVSLRTTLDDCRLLEYRPDDAATEWWGQLRALGKFSEDATKASVGFASEERTMAFEKHRLSLMGRDLAAGNIQWVSRENDHAGFDVLSENSGQVDGFRFDSALQIEVKTGRRELDGGFSFVLTRHEFRIMKTSSMAWVLHAWVFDPETSDFLPFPVILKSTDIDKVVPVPSDRFEWETARLLFPFETTRRN